MYNYLVEYLGTFFFLFIIIYTGNPLYIAIALGVAILLGEKISGGNYNPAVTIIMALAGKLPVKKVIPYIVSQLAGGISALVLYKLVAKK